MPVVWRKQKTNNIFPKSRKKPSTKSTIQRLVTDREDFVKHKHIDNEIFSYFKSLFERTDYIDKLDHNTLLPSITLASVTNHNTLLQSITLPSVTDHNTSLKSITLPSVTNHDTLLQSITLPSVTNHNTLLKSITLPSVTNHNTLLQSITLTSVTNHNILLQSINLPSVKNDQKIVCDNHLTDKEFFDALKGVPNNKSPGNDGLTKEFYETFWNELKGSFKKSIKLAYHMKQFVSKLALIISNGRRAVHKVFDNTMQYLITFSLFHEEEE